MRNTFIFFLFFFVSSCYHNDEVNKNHKNNSNTVVCYHNGELAFIGDTSADIVYNETTGNWDFVYYDGDTMSFNGDCLK